MVLIINCGTDQDEQANLAASHACSFSSLQFTRCSCKPFGWSVWVDGAQQALESAQHLNMAICTISDQGTPH